MNKIIYLDAAASSLKPESVIDAEMDFLRHNYANAGRGVCARAAAVDEMVANARRRVAQFIGAQPNQIVFTSGTTDAFNRIVNIIKTARGNGSDFCVAVSDLEHHSARLPFQVGACNIAICPLDSEYNYDVSNIPVADVIVVTAMSNVMGTAQNVAGVIAAARAKNPNVISVVDAAQYVVHDKIDVNEWGCDFLCFSAHKIGADTGLGVMYIKNPDDWPADKFGGGMVARVNGLDEFTTQPAPEKFEAGTLPLTQIAGLKPAIDYLESNRPDLNLIKYIYDELIKNPRIRILTARDAAILTFVVRDMHALDFGAFAGARGLCVRVGNMCASWIHRALGIDGSVRISVGPWNTIDDARAAVDIINAVVK